MRSLGQIIDSIIDISAWGRSVVAEDPKSSADIHDHAGTSHALMRVLRFQVVRDLKLSDDHAEQHKFSCRWGFCVFTACAILT